MKEYDGARLLTERDDTRGDRTKSENLRGFDDFELSLGDIMRGERATKGKSLLDVQRELKIKAAYISAIENTDPTAFDTPGFVAGYVRSYARYLGMDPEWAFETFCEEGGFSISRDISSNSRGKSDRSPGVKKTTRSRSLPAHERDPFTDPSVSYLPKAEAAMSGFDARAFGSIAVLLLLLGGIGYGGWSVLQEVQKVRLTPVEQTPDVFADLDPLSEAIQPAAASVDEDTTTAALPANDRVDRINRPEALDLPVMIARDGPIAAIDPDTVGALAPTRNEGFIAAGDPRPDNLSFAVPASGVTPDDEPALAELDAEDLLPPVQVIEVADPTVTLLAVRPSWVRVRGADGTVVFEKILDAGEEFEVPNTEEPPSLRAGNANSLYFSINGATYGPVGTGPEVVKGVVMSADAIREAYSIADATGDSDLARFIAVAEAQREAE